MSAWDDRCHFPHRASRPAPADGLTFLPRLEAGGPHWPGWDEQRAWPPTSRGIADADCGSLAVPALHITDGTVQCCLAIIAVATRAAGHPIEGGRN